MAEQSSKERKEYDRRLPAECARTQCALPSHSHFAQIEILTKLEESSLRCAQSRVALSVSARMPMRKELQSPRL